MMTKPKLNGDPTPKAKPQKQKRIKQNVVSKRTLISTFGEHAAIVLRGYVERVWNKDGTIRHFKLIKPLPTQEEFTALRAERFTHSLSDLLGDAYCIFFDLTEECEESFENLPPSLQDDGVEAMLQEASGIFGCLHMPDIDAQIGSLKVYYQCPKDYFLYPVECDGWAIRRDEAVGGLEAIVNVLESAKSDGSRLDNDAVDGLISDLNEAISEAESVDFPDMSQ
jgi:hypothetical protein